MIRSLRFCFMLALSALLTLALGDPTLGHAQNLNRLLKGSYGSSGGTFNCINTPPGGIDPETFELQVDALNEFIGGSGTQIFEFDGQGGFSFVTSKFLMISTILTQVRNVPLLSVIDPSAPFIATGTYTVNPDRRSFTFEYTATQDLGGGVILDYTAFQGEGFIGPNGDTLVLGIVEPQIRAITLSGAPFVEQLCTLDVTAVRLGDQIGGGSTDCTLGLLGLPCP